MTPQVVRGVTNGLLDSNVILNQLKITPDQESPRLLTSTFSKSRILAHIYRPLIVRELVGEIEISIGPCHDNLTEKVNFFLLNGTPRKSLNFGKLS